LFPINSKLSDVNNMEYLNNKITRIKFIKHRGSLRSQQYAKTDLNFESITAAHVVNSIPKARHSLEFFGMS